MTHALRSSCLAFFIAGACLPACRNLDVPTLCTNHPDECQPIEASTDTTDTLVDTAADTVVDTTMVDTADGAAVDASDSGSCAARPGNLLVNASFETWDASDTSTPWEVLTPVGFEHVTTKVTHCASAARFSAGGYGWIRQSVDALSSPLAPKGRIYVRARVRWESGVVVPPQIIVFPIVGSEWRGPLGRTFKDWSGDGNWHELEAWIVNDSSESFTGLVFEIAGGSNDAQTLVVDDTEMRVEP